MSQSLEQVQLPSLPQVLETNAVFEELLLGFVKVCHKPDRQETINCLEIMVADFASKTTSSAALVESTKEALQKLMEFCYDASADRTLESMRDAFEQVNSGLPSAYEEHLRQ